MPVDVRQIHGQALQEIEGLEGAGLFVLDGEEGVAERFGDALAVVFSLVVFGDEGRHAGVDGAADGKLEG